MHQKIILILTCILLTFCEEKTVENKASLLLECDLNSDGIVTEEEEAKCDEGWPDCDLDGDGTVASSEKEKCYSCDLNGDEKVTRKEKRSCDEALIECDTNEDHSVTHKEKSSCKLSCDLNGDGVVQQIEEKKCGQISQASDCDYDKDGTIGPNEQKLCDKNKTTSKDEVSSEDVCDLDSNGTVTQTEKVRCNLLARNGGSVNDNNTIINNDGGGASDNDSNFFWGSEAPVLVDSAESPTETEQFSIDASKNSKIQIVKVRMSVENFKKEGDGYSSKGCFPKQAVCKDPFDMDETAKLFKTNGWSLLPMLNHKKSSTIDDGVINEFVDFVDWFITSYKDSANIKYLELINSPVAYFLEAAGGGGGGTVEQLIEIQNLVYDRLKPKFPDLLIGSHGTEFHNDVVDERSQAVLDIYLEKSNGAKFDFLAFHGYPVFSYNGGDNSSTKEGILPPNVTPTYNSYANVTGILNLRKKLDENGWTDRFIIDSEHTGALFMTKGSRIAISHEANAAYLVQDALLKRTATVNGKVVLRGLVALKLRPVKIGPDAHENAWGSLAEDGSPSLTSTAYSVLVNQISSYEYSKKLSGSFDVSDKAWVEKFSWGEKEQYLFFRPLIMVNKKPFELKDDEPISYQLELTKDPKSFILKDINGTVLESPTLAKSVTLEAKTSIQYLEVSY